MNDYFGDSLNIYDRRDFPSFTHLISKINQFISNGSKVLVILRGASGSGKSTLAHYLQQELETDSVRCVKYSSDDYFLSQDKLLYNFIGSLVPAAHEWNQRRASSAMSNGIELVIIDNTNMCLWEMRPYVESGVSCGYEIEFVEPSTRWRHDIRQLSLRSVHHVAQDTIRRSLARYERVDSLEQVLHADRFSPVSQAASKLSAPDAVAVAVAFASNESSCKCSESASSAASPSATDADSSNTASASALMLQSAAEASLNPALTVSPRRVRGVRNAVLEQIERQLLLCSLPANL